MKKIFLVLCIAFLSIKLCSQSQPAQPISGPGGNDYAHGSATMHGYQTQQPTGFYIFEPSSPTPDSANVVVFIHGLNIVNPYLYGAWINHLVKHGNIVIYPKYQDVLGTTPTTAFNNNVVSAIVTALDTLGLPGHVKPRLENFAVAGHSYGGLMTANMGILAGTSGFPIPKALFSCQGYMDYSGTTRLPDYSIMPPAIKLLIVVGDNDAVVGTTFGHFLMDSTINTPTSHKNLVTHHGDSHGNPIVSSGHFEPSSIANEFNTGETNFFMSATFAGTKTDAVDYYCYWKLLDALLDCAFYGTNCNYAFGNTPEQRYMGLWSDGQPITELTIEPVSATGLPSINIKQQIVTFPVPASDKLFVSFDLPEEQVVALTVFNTLGEKVYSLKKPMNKGKMYEQLNLENLNAGTYNLLLQTTDGVFTKTIILN